MCMLRRISMCFLAFILTFTALPLAVPAVLAGVPQLVDRAVVLERPATVITESARQFLFAKNEPTVNVWVYFTDKGVFSDEEFNAKAAIVYVSDRAMARRKKMGLAKTVFADLPVVPDYVTEVVAQGATVRRISRYLNAASFCDCPG